MSDSPAPGHLTRKQLYEQVWSTPMRTLAIRYGMSDVGLAKVCQRHDIPRPPCGYWAKKQFGKAPPKTRLPSPAEDYNIDLHEVSKETQQRLQESQQRANETTRHARQEDRISVAADLRGAHRLVTAANQDLQGADKTEEGLLVPPASTSLNLEVSKSTLRRALLIMDAVLKALESRGYSVKAGPQVEVADVCVSFGIGELLETVREQPTDHNLDGYYEFGHSRFNRKRVPSGRLSLDIHELPAFWSSGCRRNWRDGKKHGVEDRLNEFVAGLIQYVGAYKLHLAAEEQRAQERRAAEERRQAEARRRAELREQVKAEKTRVDALLEQAKKWRQSQVLRDFIEAAKERHLVINGAMELDEGFSDWLRWATEQADRLDPLLENPPSVLDIDSAELEEDRREFLRSW